MFNFFPNQQNSPIIVIFIWDAPTVIVAHTTISSLYLYRGLKREEGMATYVGLPSRGGNGLCDKDNRRRLATHGVTLSGFYLRVCSRRPLEF